MKGIIKIKTTSICWWVINVILVFTFLLKQLTLLSNLALIIILLDNYPKFSNSVKRCIILSLFCVILLASYSLIEQNLISLIIRFSLILFFVIVSYFIKIPIETLMRPILITGGVLAVLMILGEIYMLFFFDPIQIASLRFFTISHGIGDIYPKYGNFYALQLVGSAALPFVFMLSFIENSLFTRYKLLYRLLILLGIIIAGNFGFLVAILFFLISLQIFQKHTYNQWFNKSIISILIIICLGPAVVKFTHNVMENKRQESNATRVDQANVLIKDMSNNTHTLLFGTGLGHTLQTKTNYRDYKDNIYYELQILYFLNQMGIVPFILFVLVNVFLTLKYIKYRVLIITYTSYLIYAITNPYILNTNQVVVIISLVSISSALKQTNKYFGGYEKQSRCCFSTI